MMSMNDKNYFLELLLKAYEGSILPEEIRILNEYIKSGRDAADLYAEFFHSISGLVEIRGLADSLVADEPAGLDTWISFLAKEEESAPALELPVQEPQKVLIQKVVYDKVPHRVSKLAVYSAVFSAAAMLLMTLFLYIAPNRTGYEVVTLTGSMNAKWMGANGPLQKGSRLCVNRSPLTLREGLAELVFDTNARVVIEGPAEFSLLADDRIDLSYGKIFASVPREAIGFKVNSPSAQIIDLGTEFGVQAELNGDTCLQMIKGKTTLITGDEANRQGVEVNMGAAKKVSAETKTVTDICYNETAFVRAFDTARNIVWRTQPSVDLADIVRNGNGLGTGNSDVRLNPVRGFCSEQHPGGVMATASGYLPIKDHPLIDGIFIPNSTSVISSRGDIFENFPGTGGYYCCDLWANPTPGIINTITTLKRTIYFNGQEYSDRGKPCIVMHSNRGITFDLDAVRKAYRSGIDQFVSQIGIADIEDNAPNANFYVLVDGKLRYSLLGYNHKGVLNPITINIEDPDRFLTLATTDGESPDKPEGSLLNQWCIFAEPELKLR